MPLIRKQLQQDDLMQRMAERSPIAFRLWVVIAFVVLAVVMGVAVLFARGLTAIISASACLVTIAIGIYRLTRERLLLRDRTITVATVSRWRRTETDGGYSDDVGSRFLASDGRVYIGTSSASGKELPHEGEPIPILYRKDDPSQNARTLHWRAFGSTSSRTTQPNNIPGRKSPYRSKSPVSSSYPASMTMFELLTHNASRIPISFGRTTNSATSSPERGK